MMTFEFAVNGLLTAAPHFVDLKLLQFPMLSVYNTAVYLVHDLVDEYVY